MVCRRRTSQYAVSYPFPHRWTMPHSRSDSTCRAPSQASQTSPQSPGQEVPMNKQRWKLLNEVNAGKCVMWAVLFPSAAQTRVSGGVGQGPDFWNTEGPLVSPSLSLPFLFPYIQSLGTHEHTFRYSMRPFIWTLSQGTLTHRYVALGT